MVIKKLFLVLIFIVVLSSCSYIRMLDLNMVDYYSDNTKRLSYGNPEKYRNVTYGMCLDLFRKKNYKDSFTCSHYAYMNSESPYSAAVNLLHKFKSAYYFGAYNYIINNFQEYKIYMDEFEGLSYEFLLILAKSYKSKIIDIDRNVYPNAKYAFMTLEKILNNEDNVPEFIYSQALYEMDKLLDIMERHEEYVAQFYKRTNQAVASNSRLKYKTVVASYREEFNYSKQKYEEKLAYINKKFTPFGSRKHKLIQ